MTASLTPYTSHQGTSPHATQSPVIGVLLVHGLNGSRRDLAELETVLQERGMITSNMLLPGHGSDVRDMLPLGWQHWADAVRDELKALKQRCDIVFLVGHSLGGALALHMAAHEEVAGVVIMCAPLHMHPLTHFVVRVAKNISPLWPTVREDVRDPHARRRYTRDVYRWTPMRPVESMLQFLPTLRAELPKVTAPALIMTSIHDHVVPARDSREIYRHIGSQEKHLVTFHHSYHVIMKDYDREEVFAKTTAFILRHASKAQPHRRNADQMA
ncbi:MAG TPA: alpha/beta fold hydrolase [Ktedonobacteraceae bacterium]|nr:alpha/beta fold hydrolase [Ktedonobacteraceae bacterium]